MTGRANGGEKGQPRGEEEKRDGEGETEFDSHIVVMYLLLFLLAISLFKAKFACY